MFSSGPPDRPADTANKFVSPGCAECEGQAEHERIKSLLKQKKGKGSGGGGGRGGGRQPVRKAGEEPLWSKSSYSTLPNPHRGRGGQGGSLRAAGQEQPGSQV
jgi:hypothetical protein